MKNLKGKVKCKLSLLETIDFSFYEFLCRETAV